MEALGELIVALFKILLVTGGFCAVVMVFYRLVQIAIRHGAHEPWISFSILLGVILFGILLSLAVRAMQFCMDRRPARPWSPLEKKKAR
jgi:hypothetical protein